MSIKNDSMKLLITVLILAIVLIAGCTQLNSVICKPNWIKSQLILYGVPQTQGVTAEEGCKKSCYEAYKVTSIKVENTTQPLTNSTGFYCYCDINNCNP